jgi:hypothetical protein
MVCTYKSVFENEDVTVFWNEGIHRDTEVTADRPDIIIKNTKVKTWVLLDVGITADRSVTQKEAEKILKYKGLCVKIHRKWNMNHMVIPIITGATAMITKRFKENLETIPGKHSIDSLQKTAIHGTSHITRTVLQCEA